MKIIRIEHIEITEQTKSKFSIAVISIDLNYKQTYVNITQNANIT